MSQYHFKNNESGNDSGLKKQRVCRFCTKNEEIDYKNVQLLSKYINDRGKIMPRKVTGLCQKHQKELARAIKTARQMALLAPVDKTMR